MKNTILYTSLVAQLLFGGSLIAAPGGGGGGGAAGGGAASGGGAAPATIPRTGIIRPNPTSPGTPGGVMPPQTGNPNPSDVTGTAATTTATNGFGVMTNNIGAMTNGLPNTNAFVGISNIPPTIPTLNPTNGGFVPKSTDINGNVVTADQTVTGGDRVLLGSLSQGLKTSLGIAPNGNLPVHFLINNGTVTVVGTAQNQAQSQGILSQVQQTPGVVSVVSDLRVAQPFGSTQNNVNGGISGVQTDHAFSARDQTLLTTVQQQAAMQLGVINSAQMPVHFSIQGGVVGVTGQMISLQEKQALLSAVSKTPGVVRVVDNIALQSAPARMNNNLPATSRSPGSNTIFLNTTNPSGF